MITSSILACVPDLMDRSKVAAAAATAGREITFVAPATLADALATADDLVLVDLSRPGVIDAIATAPPCPGRSIIGFGSHVDRDTLDAATAAGCTQVHPRSTFFTKLPTLLT